MADFVLRANLPKRAERVVIGAKYAYLLEKPLKKLGIEPIFVPDNPNVDWRLRGHADLSVFHAGGEEIWLAPYLRESAFAARLAALGARVHIADISQSPAYPRDAQLNIAALGSAFIYNPKVSYTPVTEYLAAVCGMRGAPVRQGYVKCSVLIVNERSVITQDAGIARAARGIGLDVLEIAPGYVALDGFEYGFLGGAGFKLAEDTVAFTGTLAAHPDKARISAFLAARGVSAVCLTELPLFDIGSALPITEKEIP